MPIQEIDWNSYNIVAYVITPWQLKGVEAFFFKLLEQQVEIHALVILAEHDITGRCVYADDFAYKNPDITFLEVPKWNFNQQGRFDKVLPLWNVFYQSRRSTQELWCLLPGKINFRWLRFINQHCSARVHFVLLDDGTGGYNGYSGLSGYSKKKLYIAVKNRIYYLCINKLIRNGAFTDFRLLKKSGSGFIKNLGVGKYYAEAFKLYPCNDKGLLSKFEDSVVVNSQCLFDNKEINGIQDINVYDLINTCINQRVKVVLKAHPRETSIKRYKDFEWDIVETKGVTQEAIFANLLKKPKCVVGITSSTLINTSVLFGIKTISLAYFFLNEDISESLRKDVLDFIEMFSHIVCIPKSIEELNSCINECL